MTRSSLPDQVTINWLAECVGMHPSTVKRRTTGLQRNTAGKLNRVQALEAVFIGTVETKEGRITTREAVRQLTVEKALQVRLQNEITRKERIPDRRCQRSNRQGISGDSGNHQEQAK